MSTYRMEDFIEPVWTMTCSRCANEVEADYHGNTVDSAAKRFREIGWTYENDDYPRVFCPACNKETKR